MKRALRMFLLATVCGVGMGGGCFTGAVAAGAIVPRKSLTQEVELLRAQLYEVQAVLEAIDAKPLPEGWDEMEGLE